MLILMVMALLVATISSVVVAINMEDEYAIFGLLAVVGWVLLLFILMAIFMQKGIEKGFIDAKSGKQTYILITHPDSTITWELNKQCK